MKTLVEILKASLPVAIGVTAGMFAYEQIKKATTKTA